MVVLVKPDELVESASESNVRRRDVGDGLMVLLFAMLAASASAAAAYGLVRGGIFGVEY
jgi:hypothetical protein